MLSDAISFRRKRGGFLVVLALGHHRPGHPSDLVGERDRSNLCRAPGQQCGEPWPMLGATDLGIADDGERAGREQAAQITITSLTDVAKPILTAARVLLWDESNPCREV